MCCQVRHIKLCADWFPQWLRMCQSRHMAVRKSDAEVGPLGVWAYDTARFLVLSPAQVAARAGVKEATIRKIEGGSNRKPSRRLVYEMARYFREVAAEQGVTVDDPPGDWAAKPRIVTDPGLAALLARLDDQATAINALAAQVERLVDSQAVPKATAHLVSQGVTGALRVALPEILRAAGLPPK